jgi:adenosine deaminase
MNPEDTERIERFIRRMPKVEIHLHMEGAIPYETLLGQIRRKGTEPLITTVEDLKRKLTYTDFESFIDLWVWKTGFIQEEADFEEISYSMLTDLCRQNVKYVEAFYGPGDYRRQGLSTTGITERIIAGKEGARRDCGIRCELIVDLIRDHGPEIGMRLLDEVTPYLGRGVIGVGIGGSEHSFPAGPYAPVYREARRRGFRLTAHAGEVAGADSIRAAVEDLGAERIGHGVRLHEDAELMAFLRERKVPLEMCLISNSKTGVCPSVRHHPIKDYFRQGLLVTVNSDDPTMFDSTLTDEYLALVRQLDFTLDEVKQVAVNGIEASFLSPEEKAGLKSDFQSQWAEIDRA